MKRRLLLDYTIGDLAIAPYLDGLRNGRAIAKQCGSCRRTTFPPERNCSCKSQLERVPDSCWMHLSGTASVILRTDGPDGSFALAQFEGADNRTVCRIANGGSEGSIGHLQADKREIPGTVIKIVGDAIESAG